MLARQLGIGHKSLAQSWKDGEDKLTAAIRASRPKAASLLSAKTGRLAPDCGGPFRIQPGGSGPQRMHDRIPPALGAGLGGNRRVRRAP